MIFNKKILVGSLALASLFAVSCDGDDNNDVTPLVEGKEEHPENLTVDLQGLGTLGADFEYEGWVIVRGEAVSTGTFDVTADNKLSTTGFYVDEEKLAAAEAFVLTIEPAQDTIPAPSATKVLKAPFTNDTATVVANVIPGIDGAGTTDGDFTALTGKYFLRTPTDEADGMNNGNDQNGIWFGTPGAPPTAGFENLPVLDAESGWRYEGWVVVEGFGPLSTGTFLSAEGRDSSNIFSGTEANMGPPVPGEDFLNIDEQPEGLTFPLNVRGLTTVISLEPYPDNSPAPFDIKPLASMVAEDAATAPATHSFGDLNTASFPSGTVTRK